MKYCKNCGAELREGAKVCTQCGAKQPDGGDAGQHKTSGEYTRKNSTHQPKKPMEPRKKKILWASVGGAIIVILALFITYKVLENIYSPDSMLNDFSAAVSNEDPEALKSAVATDISDEEAEAYISLIDNDIGFSQFSEWVANVNTELKENSYDPDTTYQGYELFTLSEDGKHLGLFDDYELTIPKYNVKVDSEASVDTFTYQINGEDKEWSTNSEKFAELIPGKYIFTGSGIKDDESFDARMTVDFAVDDASEGAYGDFEVDLYYVAFTAPILSSFQYDIAQDDITLNVNGEELEDVDLNNSDASLAGPFHFGEDYEITGTLNYEDENFDMEPVTLNLSSEDMDETYETSTPYHEVEIDFDNEALASHQEDVREKERNDERREEFEGNMEDEVELFLRDYLYALEDMYREEDVSEVEDFIEADSVIESTFQSNIDAGTFEGMLITNIDFSNYEENDGSITIDVSSKRNYDALDSPADFNNRYNVEYNSDDLSFTITHFEDI